ncbi:oocyte zinc finger protein XlCOF20 [Homalodisca vitripennis]|uniref:oocyte zinc finger protein XlCOF20 n=1 Tax=Homalodisca vitripennis TaxID=197043 RepID=UPI001EEAAA32|nr:oocyte zinc finger protein XlCOF20 [Homalodisca vitripennis]
MNDSTKNGFLEITSNSILQQHLEAQSHQKMKLNEPQSNYSLKVPQIHHTQEAFTMVPDDGLGYDDGVRVLRAIGTWAPDYPNGSSTYQPESIYPDINKKMPPQTSSVPVQQFQMSSPKPKPKVENNNKSFTCTECGKGLARKDKLVIHMRIHTGEKPYVCEVCKKAFARRDKLVIHMNKLNHLTPSNLAPLSKRPPDVRPQTLATVSQRKEMKDESTSPPPLGALMAPQATWSCELCGRVLPSREEWSAHTRAHLEPPTPYPPPDQSYCLMCHQAFPDREQFMFHLRTHFRPADTTQVCS